MAPRVDTEKLITAVETHPPLWDTRVDGYHDRLTVERHWNQVAEEVYPNNAWSRCSPAKRAKYVDLVKRRWRSARDQYRREYNPIPSSSSQGRKRRYVYYEQISFLAPILEVTQTEDNLDESDDEPTAGPSATATSASEQEPAREDIEIPETQQDAANDSHEGGTESAQTNTQGSSTQQTTTPATQSTQTNVLPRFAPQPLRARRIRRPEEMRSLPEIIDTRIIHIMNTLIPETDAERFCRSLSTSLTKIPSDRQERVRAAMLTLLSASQAEQEPVRVYEAIENWRTIMQQHTVPNTTDNQNTISTQTTMATVIVNNPLLQQSGQPSIASSTLFPTPIRQGYVATNTGALSTVQSATSQQPMNYMNLQPTQTTSYFTQPTNIGGLPNLFPGSTYPQSFMMPHYPISTMLPTPHLQTSVNYPQGQQHTHTQYPITHVDPQVYSTTELIRRINLLKLVLSNRPDIISGTQVQEHLGSSDHNMKYISAKKKIEDDIGPLKDYNRIIIEDKEKAEILSRYFLSVFTKERTVPRIIQKSKGPDMPNLTQEELHFHLSKLNIVKFPGNMESSFGLHISKGIF
ncbi:uncharacterized protein LOC142249625 [Anomaloglossus baeobatrachus]|uniref:uncharacterized protein LOC142249625 n=1 Tax=Anomaloglossus baeobatrachus TaxID=238106 RepID=UPI003F50C5A3